MSEKNVECGQTLPIWLVDRKSESRIPFWRLLLSVLLTIGSFGCSGGSSAPPIQVQVSPTSAIVQAAQGSPMAATVSGDSSGKGVNWMVSCSGNVCGSISPTSTASGGSTTYLAPTSAPASDLTVTVTAASASDPSKTASAKITVPAIVVSVSPSTSTIQVNASAPFTAMVNNDPAGSLANWTVSCPTAPCGSASPTQASSGAAVTYTAPATPPASDMTVTLTATSVTDNTKNATAKVTIPSSVLSIAVANSTVPGNGTTQVSATVSADPGNKGVTWSLTCSPTPCGSLSATSTTSGVATTYSAPTPPASDLAVTVNATSVADPASVATATITIAAITVTMQPTSATVIDLTTAPLIANVGNDLSNQGVTWTVSCSSAPCGSVSPTSTASGAATTYAAPTSPPASDLAVTVTATSVADRTKSGVVNVTVPAVSVSQISPYGALMPLGAVQQFSATVSNDGANQGLNWTLTQNSSACSPICGTLSFSTSASAAPVTYTVPASAPASASVTLTATSVTDSTKSASATISISTGTVQLAPNSLTFPTCKLHPRDSCKNEPILTVSLTNTGTSALTISNVAISGPDFAQTNDCTASVNPAGDCTFSVQFTPSKAAIFTEALTITDSSTDSPQAVTLKGQATQVTQANQDQAHADLAATTWAAVPVPTGPQLVGTRMFSFTDFKRTDPYLANGAQRELSVRFWYPAAASATRECQPAEYAAPAVWNYYAHLVGVAPFPVKTNSCSNAPVDAGPHPLILFTPGYTATATDYTFLAEDLASRGYVVASVNHTYEATAVQLGNGKLVRSVVGSHLGGPMRRDAGSLSIAVSIRLLDLKSVLDQIDHLNASSDSPFAGRLDMTRIVIAGHSLGGLTAFLGSEVEPRIKAVVMLDGFMPTELGSATRKPVLMIVGDRMQFAPGECRLWNNLEGPRTAVSLRGVEHVAFSDWLWLSRRSVQAGPMGPERTMQAVRDYVTAFLDANVRGDSPSSLLTGPSSLYPGAALTSGDQALCAGPPSK
jgi:predicted dienelactone hydrolase